MAENFYDLLGVSEDASTAVIEDAYREEIKRVHPDVSDDVDAGERTKRLNKAKQVLTDEDERAQYDSVGHETYLSGGSTGPETTESSGPGATATSGNTHAAGATSTTSGTASSRSRSDGGTGGGYERHRRSGTTGRTRRQRSATANESQTNTATGTATGSNSTWSGRRDGNGQGRSSPSRGPAWQSARTRRATGGAAGATATGPSGQRQASAGSTGGTSATRSWNAWEQTRSWAVRQGGTDRPGFDPNQLVPTEQSVLLMVSTFFLYPFFVASALYPLFPVVARFLVALCTLMMFAYLLSVPEVSVAVFGLWSVLAPVALVVLPGVGLFSLLGVVALSTTWVPFGLSVLTLSVMES